MKKKVLEEGESALVLGGDRRSLSPPSDSPLALDIHDLFCHYSKAYFHDSLHSCFVSWSSIPSAFPSWPGACSCFIGGCEILLFEPVLKFRSADDVKNVLLHEMIHAFLWIKNRKRTHSYHGPKFQNFMNEINCSSAMDHHRPYGGYNITADHELFMEVNTYRFYHWTCDTCGNTIKRTRDREPSVSDCPDKVSEDGHCSNTSCDWHIHKKGCSGSYTRKAGPGFKENKMTSKGDQNLQDAMSEVVPYVTRLSTRNKTKGLKEKSTGKPATIASYFQPAVDVKKNSGNSSYRIGVQKELTDEDFDTTNLETKNQVMALETCKLEKASTCKRKRQIPPCRKRNRQYKKEYAVAVGFLNVYGDEESEEDIEPLINKRTERRKKQMLLQSGLKIEDINNDSERTELVVEGEIECQGNFSHLCGDEDVKCQVG